MTEPFTKEEINHAHEKIAQIKIYQLTLIKEIFEIACSRGAFKADELSHVGAVNDTIRVGIEKALQMSREELGKKESDKLVISSGPV